MELTDKQLRALYSGVDGAVLFKDDKGGYSYSFNAVLKKNVPLVNFREQGSSLEDWKYIDYIYKPKLRLLSSIIDEECIELCKICHSLAFEGSAKWRVYRKPNYISVESKYNDYSFSIDKVSGEIDTYIDSELTTTSNCAMQVIYLLSKGFDLFGLIDKGRAIDINKG